MANQYMGSFEHKIREKFSCSAQVLLIRCAEEGLTYQEVAKKTGIAHATIRKWAKRYNVELELGEALHEEEQNVRALFFAPQLNVYNILSRRWQTA